MKISRFFPAGSASSGTVLVVTLAAVLTGAAVATAQTYRHGNSTTIIEQSGSSTDSDSQVRHYRNGQTIVTENGNSTDITVQREDDRSAAGDSRDDADDYFSRRFGGERFSRSAGEDGDEAGAGSDFERRMHERLHRTLP